MLSCSKEESRTLTFLASLQFFPISFPVAELAGRLNRIALVTDNTGDCPMKEIQLYPLPQV